MAPINPAQSTAAVIFFVRSIRCRHGLRSQRLEAQAPRLLQDHSPTGEPHYTALVEPPGGSGELLVNGSEHRVGLGSAHTEASDA